MPCVNERIDLLQPHQFMSASGHAISSSLTLSGLSLFMIEVFPLLSSPIQRTLSSFFFKPNNLPSLSKNPMIVYICSSTLKNNCFWKLNELFVTTRNAIATAEDRKLHRLTSYKKWRLRDVVLDEILSVFQSRFVGDLRR